VAALEQWPESGVPRNPGAWLMAVAKRRAIDLLRRRERFDRKLTELGHELETDQGATPDIEIGDIEDDLLRLVLRVVSSGAVHGRTRRADAAPARCLTTDEIARAYLVSEATVAQRIVRAKRTLGDAGVPFEVPRATSSPTGCRPSSRRSTDLQRGICGDRRRGLDASGAVRGGAASGRVLAELMPTERRCTVWSA